MIRFLARASIAILFLWGAIAPGRAVGADRPMLLHRAASEDLLETGRRYLFDFRLRAAEETFRRLVHQPDGRAAGYHHLAMVALFKGLVTDEDTHFETFFGRSDTLKSILGGMPESVWRDQLEAETNLHRVVAAGKLGRYIRAALAARSAYNGFEDLVETNPTFSEAYFGMGVLHLTVASLPAGWRRLLRVLGFEGTATQGLSEIRRAAEHSRFSREQARVFLALADIVLRQKVEQGAEQLAQLHREHPESMLYAHLYGFALYSNRQAKMAEQVFRGAMDNAASTRYFYIDYIDYYLGETLFVQDDFAGAETYYRRYLARHNGPALRAFGRYRLGLSLEMQGERQKAVRVYEQVKTERDFDSDMVAERWAKKRIRAPMDSLDRRAVYGENAFQSGRYDRAEQIQRGLFHDPDATAAHRAEAAYYLGRTFHVQDRYDEAFPPYFYAANNPGDPEAEWGPWAQLYIGEIYAEQSKTQQAIRAYEKALDYETPYDWYQSLEQQARIALERLWAEQ